MNPLEQTPTDKWSKNVYILRMIITLLFTSKYWNLHKTYNFSLSYRRRFANYYYSGLTTMLTTIGYLAIKLNKYVI